jgi:hypothetical protein
MRTTPMISNPDTGRPAYPDFSAGGLREAHRALLEADDPAVSNAAQLALLG